MKIEVPKEIDKKIKDFEKLSGIKKEEIIRRALTLYLEELSQHIELLKEFELWDKLSDEALINFEKSL